MLLLNTIVLQRRLGSNEPKVCRYLTIYLHMSLIIIDRHISLKFLMDVPYILTVQWCGCILPLKVF